MHYDSLALAGGIEPIATVLEIARLHRAEGPLAIASGSVRRLVTRTLDTLAIADWFTTIVAAEDTTRHKPEPDVSSSRRRAASASIRRTAPSTKTPTSASRPPGAPE